MAFYKKDGDELLVGESFVSAPGFELLAENHAEYEYPIDGWYWFDTEDDALLTLGITPQINT